MTIAQTAAEPTTREERGVALYRTRKADIHEIGEELYLVPSCTGMDTYRVDLEAQTCTCPDYIHHGRVCKHQLAATIYAAKKLCSQEDDLQAHYASLERMCTCSDGWVFVGRVVESEHDLDGEVVEYERVPCRRCADSR